MNFIKFLVSATNIFPAVNSTTGGSLLTEYNLRSRESISTFEQVPYMIGHSYTHSIDDFNVRVPIDGEGVPVSTSIIEITEGRALVNGHFIESLAPIQIDLAEVNAYLLQQTPPIEPLVGKLCIGLKAMYSTQANIAGAIRVENNEGYFEGIQVVILPEAQFKLPNTPDSGENYTEESEVTAHLKLGSFIYSNGAINVQSIDNNYPDRCVTIDAARVGNIDDAISNNYISKTGLQPHQLYVYSGKNDHESTDSEPWIDSWCQATDSLMIWDKDVKVSSIPPVYSSASIVYDKTSDTTDLIMPHKQIDGMTNTAGEKQYFAERRLTIPNANYEMGTGGVVSHSYTQSIKKIREAINQLYRLPAGKQIGYIDVLSDISDLPPMNDNWSIGDYIVVGQDQILGAQLYVSEASSRAPSSFYVVLPGYIQSVDFKAVASGASDVPESIKGIQISSMTIEGEEAPNTDDPEIYNAYWGLPSDVYRGVVGEDYFLCEHINEASQFSPSYYYYVVNKSGPKEWSNAVLLTGTIPLATESVIGGFYNVPDTALDSGYVYLDSTGHLRLLDYGLLRTGVLAYQLGEDYDFGSGLSADEIQIQLADYVNDRVAFPNQTKIADAAGSDSDPYTININIELSAEEEEATLTIQNIDSRFDTAVNFIFTGTVNNLTINFINCQKLKITNSLTGSPIINLENCNLYYDCNVINSLNRISNLQLWYKKYEETDPNLAIDGMNVISLDGPVDSEDIEYWTTSVPNDNHYSTALRNVEFANDGTIIGMGIYIRNNTTENVLTGKFIYGAQYEVPQGDSLQYPITCLVRQVKIDGCFATSYKDNTSGNWYVIQTTFTALSQTFDITSTAELLEDRIKPGTISMYAESDVIDNYILPEGTDVIDGWSPEAYHQFQGGII